ncbi:MAG TPA: beta-propeller domain-containing protein [Nevskiaceae bacterium]|nr:beta-propeller domain-containing protein [Nevskiaceae bacterium]
MLLSMAGLGLAACSGGAPSADTSSSDPLSTPKSRLALKAFAPDCSDFLSTTADQLTEQYLDWFRCPPGAMCPIAIDGPLTPGTAGAPAGAGAPLRVSQTNTQETGVDEPDIVRSDSQGNIYVLRNSSLLAFAGVPASSLGSNPTSTLALGDENFYATDFFLDEAAQRLVIFGQQYDSNTSKAVTLFASTGDPLNPALVGSVAIEGYGIDARRIGGRVHRVSGFYPNLPSWFYDNSDPLEQLREQYRKAQANNDQTTADQLHDQVRTEIGKRVDDAGATAFLPVVSSNLGGTDSSGYLACDQLSHPDVTTGEGMTLVDSFDTTGDHRDAADITSYNFLIYASTQNLYLVQPSFGWFFAPLQRDETAVFRLALSDSGPARYSGLGKVQGWVRDSYALSEFDNMLRVVTSTYQQSSSNSDMLEPVTQLAVLDATQADMPKVGGIDAIAAGEQLQGARFFGTRGFVDTFRYIDPLFALDLSDPTHPVVADELSMPGFSSYIAPVGDNLLLTVGRGGTDQRLNGQVGVGLFDIADLHQVKQLASLSPSAGDSSYSYSTAEYDPHAFSYFADSADTPSPGTLSIPLQTYSSDTPADDFSGFLVVRVDAAADAPLAELGRVDHRGLGDAGGCAYPGATAGGGTAGGGTTTARPCYNGYYTQPRRSIFMQQTDGISLYTFSDLGVIASDAAAPDTEQGRKVFPAP